ncbi:hypothetical protein H4582DRAFT_1917754 [Lactarius indigo]|nr:hypothetical protein H4582DRAFT_1917754 [Lactarius indigo]
MGNGWESMPYPDHEFSYFGRCPFLIRLALRPSKNPEMLDIYTYSSEKLDVSQVVDLTLSMTSSHRPPPPTFPQPPSAPTSFPTPSVASDYLSAGPVQGYRDGRHPRIPNTRATSSPLPPQYEYSPPQHQSAYPPASQYISESARSHPAFPTHQVQTHAPPNHSDLPPRAHRSVTMPIPELHNDTNVDPGLPPSYTLQAPSISHTQSYPGMSGAPQIPVDRHRHQYDSYNGGDWVNPDNSATHSGGLTPKSPPSRPIVGALAPNSGPRNHSGLVQRLFNRGNQPQNQTTTPAPPATAPRPATRCRLPGCSTIITGDVATRWNGFCCTSHRDWSGVTTPYQHSRR